jgi:hypothetical protein
MEARRTDQFEVSVLNSKRSSTVVVDPNVNGSQHTGQIRRPSLPFVGRRRHANTGNLLNSDVGLTGGQRRRRSRSQLDLMNAAGEEKTWNDSRKKSAHRDPR